MSELQINREDFILFERALKDGGVPHILEDLKDHPECAKAAFEIASQTLPLITTSYGIGMIAKRLADLPDPGDVLLEAFRLIRPFIVDGAFGATSHGWGVGEALRTKARARHVDPILELLLDRTYRSARQMLPYALVRFKRRKADILPILFSLLDDEIMTIQIIAVLGRIGDPQAIPHILPFLDDKDWGKEARKALRKLGYDLGVDLDYKALSSYRQLAAHINRIDLTHYTISGPPESMWASLIPLFESGYGTTEARNLSLRAEEMEVEESDIFGFDVVHQGEPTPLLIEVFMDDVDLPDVTFWTSQTLIAAIEEKLQIFF